ncbi:hypothetical protein WJX79_002772 [Trebouxia sp. C0005]
MSALGGTLRQEGLKVAEARVRALTREVGSLKEDLRREIKRRERATLNIREAEEFKQEAEKRVKQLEYSKRKLEQESFAAQEESRANAAKSRAAATCAREELAAYEGNLAEQTADSHHQLQHICTHLQELQMLLFSPAELGDPPLSSGVAPLVESKLKAVMHALSHLSSTLPGEPTCSALTAPASPCCHGRQEHKSHHKELERLRTEVALLRAQNQVQQDTSCRSQAANDMESLIPEYRSTLARMKRQVDELHSKLEDACCERDSLQQQVENTRKAVKLGGNAKKSKRNSSPRVSEEDEDAKQLIKDIRGLKHRCQALEAQADSLGVTNCELQTALAGKEEQLQRQARVIADLEATITAQSSDIRTALQLVTHKHDSATPYLRLLEQAGARSVQHRAFASQDLKRAATMSQGEAKGKAPSEAPTTPSQWQGTQRGHLVLGISGVLCAGILYSWVKSQNADKEVLADKNHKGESKQFPAASK